MIKNKIKYIIFLAGLICCAVTNNAYAFDLFKPNDGNWLIKNVFETVFNPETSMLKGVSEVFLAGVLALGGVLAGYTLLAGTMNTANDGEMLGKKWSGVWLPVRTSLGVAMILPVKGGFCCIQLIILWLATQAIGLGDQTWNRFSDNPLQGSVMPQPVIDKQVSALYKNAVSSFVCINTMNQKIDRIVNVDGMGLSFFQGMFGKIEPGVSSMTTTATGGSKRVIIDFGDRNGDTFKNVCGSISYDLGNSKGVSAGLNSAPELVNSFVDLHKIQEALIPAQMTALKEVLEKAKDTAQKISYDRNSIKSADIAKDMIDVADSYKKGIMTTANTAYTKALNSNVSSSMKNDGFPAAGAWFIKITMAQSAVSNMTNNVPVSSGVSVSGELKKLAFNTMFDSIEPGQEEVNSLFSAADKINNNGASGGKGESGGDGDGNFLDKLMVAFSPSELAGLFSYQQLATNPVVTIFSIGHKLINFSLIAFASVLGIVFGIGTAANVLSGGVIAATNMATPLITGLLLTMLIAGIRMAYVLAWKPFIIWSGAIIGWLVLVAESLFAAPLWAMAHLAPDQDGVVGKMGQGYMMILSLFLRPVLMVIGFVTGLTLMTPCLLFINSFMAFNGDVIGVGTLALVGKVVMITIYIKVVEQVMNKLFGLIHSMPDSILQWIGGGLSRVMGEYANGIESGTEQTTDKVNHGVSKMGVSVSGLGQKFTKQEEDRRDQNKKNKMNKD